jgi:hypothetical protein
MAKGKLTHTTDAQIFRAVAILVLISGAYMLVWTLVDPMQPHGLTQEINIHGVNITQPVAPSSDWICVLPFWDYIISIGI